MACGLLAMLGTFASAATVDIDTGGDPDARLELRNVTLPDGSDRDLYVIRAERVTVRSDDIVIIASHLEFDPEERTVRIIGRGRVERPDEVLTGDDLVVDLGDGRLEGREVWVLTDRVNVFGVRAERVDGRIRLLTGDIAPCDRCGQTIEDYGFLAERVEILPGDRILAWDAVVLIRDRPLLTLPLLVLPIAEPERLPRFSLTRGTASAPSWIELDWPYVAGPSAYGTLRARLRLDVDPSEGGPIDGRVFGGRIEAIDPEGGFVHRFIDPFGSGRIELDVRPAYPDDDSDRSRVHFEATYRSDDLAGRPQVAVRFARDDTRRPDVLESEVRIASHDPRDQDAAYLRLIVTHRSSLLLAGDVIGTPSWDGPSEPTAVPLAFTLEAAGRSLRAGPLTLTTAELELGAYDDQPNPANRNALRRTRSPLGRLETSARLELAPTSLGPFEIDGINDFVGRYYATAERQVDWETRFRARLPLGGLGALSMSAVRDAAEGETPFAFDRIRARTRSVVRANLDLTPWTGTSVRAEGGYVLEDDRTPTDVGWTPTRIRATFFATADWVDLAFEHRADPLTSDVGTLRTEASLRWPSSRWVARASGAAVADLDPRLPPDRNEREVRDVGEGSATLAVGLRDRLVARVDAGYDVEAAAGDRFDWRPVRLSLTAGTLAPSDAVPGAEVHWEFDPDDPDETRAGYQVAAEMGSVRFELEQVYGPSGGRPGTHRYALIWTDVAQATVEGWELVPAAWLNLAPDPDEPRAVAVTLRDAGSDPTTRFVAGYRSTRIRVDSGTERRNSRLEATIRLDERTLGAGLVRLAFDGFADIALRDDTQATSYLRRASLEASLDIAAIVGLQGTVGYRGAYDATDERVRSGRLSLQEVSLVVRASSELYLGATLDDVWEIVDDDRVADLAIDPRPTFFLTWDRCCWALYASWDTRSGEVLVTLGAPGTAEGPQIGLDEGTGPTLPWPPSEGEDPP